MPKFPKIVVILGPTASGKTELAIFLAKKFNGEIVSADSRQVYKYMNIGTAKPEGKWSDVSVSVDSRLRGNDSETRAYSHFHGNDSGADGNDKVYIVDGIPHYLLDIIEPDEEFSLVDYKKKAEEKIDDILSRGKLPIIVGGTGLYIWSIVDNLDIPNVAPNKELRAELEKLSLEEMVAKLQKEDPETAQKIDLKNSRRVIRALEVVLSSKDSFVKQRTKSRPKYEALQIGLKWSREELNDRINNRVDIMVKNGLVEEVENIAEVLDSRLRGNDKKSADSRFRGNDKVVKGSRLPKKTEITSSFTSRNESGDRNVWKLPSMSGIGYRQIGHYLRGEASLSEAIEILKNDTRHFAKRQMTWFKRDKRIEWLDKADQIGAEKLIKNFLQEK